MENRNYEENIYVSRVELVSDVPEFSYLRRLPLIKNLKKAPINIQAPVTFFVGENGMGKSTLIEAIAVFLGFNAEGGTMNFSFETRATHSELYNHIIVSKTVHRKKQGFFLRAESFYNVASYIDDLQSSGFNILGYYGGRSFHRQSHGESFLSLVANRFSGNGIYILDEPEAALSPNRLMYLMSLIDHLVKKGAQFIISTHSPILMTLPNSEIYELTSDSIEKVSYEETEHYIITKQFLDNPRRMLGYLGLKEKEEK